MNSSTPISSTPAPGRKRSKARTAVVGVLAAGLLLGGGVIAANAATSSSTSTTAAATSQPTATAAATSQSEATAATAAVAAKTALVRHPLAAGLRFFVNGDSSKPNYGQRAARIATFILDKRPKLAAKLPAALQADLKALKDAADSDRVAKATHIRDTALNGGYGPKIQAQAKRMQEQKADRKA
ncbi:hypothetical protein [Arthrobacter sp. B2a2-09]|uniref:hypothetical protein n=1 Tax=Arthrobacter sp. B2a2-09 TaxID=2952822 RepID=UPI0022CD6E89|nr:hypothetical protein [Arthrobacter sp. B2a2-09]MCZ9882140.1 hypothetical protein [Arthrobacter sp. B2a2-09]